MLKLKHFFLLFVFIIVCTLSVKHVLGWGFWGHQRINRVAVFCLPEELSVFYKKNIEYITEKAVDADKRRNLLANEAPRHYIDLDHYGKYPYENVPRKWKDAVAKFTQDSLQAYGIVPWHVDKMMHQLTVAFKEKNRQKILRLSADIGHYIADAHVPLHTTENYNGQLTNQVGIHAFWESRIPELMGENYDYFIGKAEYIELPLHVIWQTVLQSNTMVDSVLTIEKKLTELLPDDERYSIHLKGGQSVRVQSEKFTKKYNELMNNMVERRMRCAIFCVASFWYTAWVNAGQPDVKLFKEKVDVDDNKTDSLKNKTSILIKGHND